MHTGSRTTRARRPLPALLALLALLGWAASVSPALAQPPQDQLQDLPPDRALTSAKPGGPVRYVLVKAMGQGDSPQAAEEQALKAARSLAAAHLKALGGEQALDPSPEGQRVVALHHFPVLGFGQARAAVRLELRLRSQEEPLPAASALPVLHIGTGAGTLTLDSTRPCEAVAALTSPGQAEPALLPGGVQMFRLSPGNPVRQPLPRPAGQTLHVLACTGGLQVPANPASLEEAFSKARTGKTQPNQLQGVVSDCVELRQPLAGSRSLRLKGSEAPVDMTGAAGRAGEPMLPKGNP